MTNNIGADHRHKERIRQIEKIKTLARRIFTKEFPNPDIAPSNTLFLKKWASITTALEKSFGSIRDYKLAFNHLVHLIEKHKKVNGWMISSPTYLFTQKAEKQLRTREWLQQAWAFQYVYQSWFNTLNKSHLDTPEKCYQALMLSFMCQSGHCNIHLLEAFSILLVEPIKLHQCTERPFITLTVDDKGVNTNVHDHNATITQYICYLSPLTLGLIRLWANLDHSKWKHPADRQQTYQAIITNLSGICDKFPNTLKKLASCAISVTEQLPNANLSQALIEYSIGNIKSYSLPQSNLARVEFTPVSNCAITRFYDFKSLIVPTSSTYKTVSTSPPSDLLSILADAIKRDNPKIKLSPDKLRERLSNIDTTTRPFNQQLLIEWLLIKSYTCKASTIATYHSSLTRRWLFATEGKSLTNMNADDFESLYQSLIDDVATLKAKTYLSARLTQLHGFGVNRYNLPPLLNPIEPASDKRKHTRSGFIDETLFAALLRQINQLCDLNHEEKNALMTLLIISYRCGLRLGELTKLRLCDIENSGIGWIEVRNNTFGDNKTASALRKVPLFPMLLEHESEIVNQHLMLKRAKASRKTNLVFTLGQDSYLPIDKFLISNFTKHVLRELSRLSHLVFHHLRHSCLSRLQIMAEIDHAQNIIPNVVPYSLMHESKISHLIFGKSLRNRYYALAAFAGHSSPETCFNNYFHFSDWLIGWKLSMITLPISKQLAMSMNLCSRRHFLNLKAQNTVLFPDDFRPYLTAKLKPIALIKSNQSHDRVDTADITSVQDKKYSLELCYTVLDHIHNGLDIQEIAFKFRLDSSLIDRWVANATYIRQLHTQNTHSQPRHFSPARQNKLLPGMLQSSEERKMVSKWVISFRQHYKEQRDEINWAILYALNHTNINQSGINFNQPGELTRFISAVEFVIAKSYWRVVVHNIEQSPIQRQWKDAYSGISSHRGKKGSSFGRIGQGTVRLELRHPHEKKIRNKGKLKKFSSHALIYLFHMMGIMMFNPKKVLGKNKIKADSPKAPKN